MIGPACAGRYTLERTLGQGGMAIVYLAHDAELERPIAVKLLAENLVAEEAVRTRFLREARIAASLGHPNVVSIYDVGHCEGRPFIVMEYVDGATLEELHRRGRLSAAAIVDLALQACAGLAHAHTAGVIHRDVKPTNLLVRSDGVLKIADFGIARAAHAAPLTETGTILGTAAYLAPEQARGEVVTPAADIYSLGSVLYELLAGAPPYVAGTISELVAKQAAGDLVPLGRAAPDVPPRLASAIARCLEADAGARPSASALARELADARAETPQAEKASEVRTLPLVPPEPVQRRRGRRRWAIPVAAVAIALGAGIGAAVDGGGSGETPPGNEPRDARARVDAGDPAELARQLAAWLRAQAD